MTIIKIKKFRGKLIQPVPKTYFFQTKEFIDDMENNEIPEPGKIVKLQAVQRRSASYPEMLAGLQKACRKKREEIKADPFPTIEALQEEVGRMHAIIECIKSIVWAPVLRGKDGHVQYPEPIEPHIEAKWKLDRIKKILINSNGKGD